MNKEATHENELLSKILSEEIKATDIDTFLQRIRTELQLSEERTEFLKKILNGTCKLSINTRNEIFRCLVKKNYENKGDMYSYDQLELAENNIISNGPCWEYDPAKNGQNIIKHGIEFGSVASYGGGDFGRLISYTAPGRWINEDGEEEEEERRIVFSKYYTNGADKKFFLDRFKDDDILCIASVVTMHDMKFRFISSRVIKADSLAQLTREIKNLIKDLELDEQDKNIINNLRESALSILAKYYDFSLNN
ncbi:hypothetical protein P255_00533 [Acinetobacter brisouii CIP 110357]|uniref:Uncharacterized protein n=1 Tax=Acinetobacter brisouii CIP 110357 TaxID=1341683 RepID=V2UQY8_9GAMM|nr:hypothetical protein [Acinetobacter brisouii]ENV46394.1 hypothetical protein F954_02373 [Acinetobacter brisouii ANC 4119]ESK52382.1 hypothetical protein P255_00533 [Acinetobacter brisouii CIP 110357]